MSKKLIIGIIIFLVIAAGLVVGLLLVQQQQELRKKAAPASALSILPSTTSVQQNEEFDLTVNINSNENLVIGADLAISFDPKKLTLQQLVPGTFLPVVLAQPQIDNTRGSATVTFGAQPANPPQGQGVLATLKFKAKGAGTASVMFSQGTRGRGIDEGLGDIIVARNPSSVTILGAQATPTPSPTPIVTPSPSPTPTPSVTPTPQPSPTPTTSSGGGGGSSSQQSGGGTTTTTASPKPKTTELPKAGVSMPTFAAAGAGIVLLVLGLLLAL